MHVLTVAVSLIILPLALVHIAICVNESTLSIGLVVSPVSFIERPVCPYLGALTISLIGFYIPFSLVHSAIVELLLSLLLSLNSILTSDFIGVLEWTEVRPDLLHPLILVVGLSIEISKAESAHRLSLETMSLLDSSASEHSSEDRLDFDDDCNLVATSQTENLCVIKKIF